MIRRTLLCLSWFALPVMASVPERIEPFGQPLTENKVLERISSYCAPIMRWNEGAYDMCIESGLNVNRASREYHKRNCAHSGRPQCEAFETLYFNNFRLWQGSVDNVARAIAYSGGKSKPSKLQRQCENALSEESARRNRRADEFESWMAGLPMQPGMAALSALEQYRSEIKSRYHELDLQLPASLTQRCKQFDLSKQIQLRLSRTARDLRTNVGEYQQRLTSLISREKQRIEDEKAARAACVAKAEGWQQQQQSAQSGYQQHLENLIEQMKLGSEMQMRQEMRGLSQPWYLEFGGELTNCLAYPEVKQITDLEETRLQTLNTQRGATLAESSALLKQWAERRAFWWTVFWILLLLSAVIGGGALLFKRYRPEQWRRFQAALKALFKGGVEGAGSTIAALSSRISQLLQNLKEKMRGARAAKPSSQGE